jgi:hypothetical protein
MGKDGLCDLVHAFLSYRYFHIGLVGRAFMLRVSYAYEVGSSPKNHFTSCKRMSHVRTDRNNFRVPEQATFNCEREMMRAGVCWYHLVPGDASYPCSCTLSEGRVSH